VKLMAQFQPKVPHPLGDDLPAFLTTGGMTTPAVGILFLILISQGILESASMQIERHHIDSRDSLLGELGQEEFVDDSLTGDADPALPLRGRMGRNHNPAPLS
jgi:hypothetical protein